MSFLNESAPPLSEDLLMWETDPQTGKRRLTGKASDGWSSYFLSLYSRLSKTAQTERTLHIDGTAAIAATAVPMPSESAGLFRVTYYARITVPGTVSSSLQVVFAFTDGTVVCSAAGTAITGNTTATHRSESFLVRVDANAPITYSTVYASVGATSMEYDLDLMVERVGA